MTVSCQNSSSYTGAINPVVLSYTYDYGDNTPITTASTHAYAAAGTYTITLTMTATDSLNNNALVCTNSATQSVTVSLNCATSFSSSNVQNYYQFYASTQNYIPSNSVQYDWDFDDGTILTNGGQIENHIYAATGNYNVCLTRTFLDASNNVLCTSTACNLAAVPSLATFTCNPSFTHQTSNFQANFTNTSTLSPQVWAGINTTYTYDYGDNSPTSNANSHTYAAAGNYNVCLTMTTSDSMSNAVLCTNTYCNTISIVPLTTTCEALFAATQDSFNNMTYYFDSSPSFAGIGNITSYAWDFGDANTSSLANPMHTYAASGQYNVCLTITTSNNCTDTYCLLINVQNQGPATSNSLAGQVLPAGEAMVYLIEYDALTQSLYATQSYPTNSNGYFYFGSTGTNPHLVKAAYHIYDPNYTSHLPTYYSSNALWSGATNVNAPTPFITLNMLTGTPTIGPGFLGGNVTTGANKTAGPGDPKVKLNALLFDVNQNEFIAFTRTDFNGDYEFNGVPIGDYKIFIEELGKTMTEANISLSAANATYASIDFESNSTENHPMAPLSVDNIQNENNTKYLAYPNPTSNQFRIEGLQGNEKIILSNFRGQVLQTYDPNQNSFDMSSISPGAYILSIQNEHKQDHIKLMKID